MSNYKVSIKILSVLTELAKAGNTNITTSLETVFGEIFGQHLSWRYSSLYQKVQLSTALLKLVLELLQSPKMSGAMIELFRTNEVICRILLTLSCLNSDEIDETASTSEYFTGLLIEQVSRSFTILELLLEKLQDEKESKLMVLFTRRTENDSVCGFILKAVSGFIFHKSNSDLPFVAIRLLRRLCYLDQISLNATLGSYVFQLRNNLITKMVENERLQNCVIELLATIAEYQPSLLEIFVDLVDDKDNPGNL